jgi:hypothetical protein
MVTVERSGPECGVAAFIVVGNAFSLPVMVKLAMPIDFSITVLERKLLGLVSGIACLEPEEGTDFGASSQTAFFSSHLDKAVFDQLRRGLAVADESQESASAKSAQQHHFAFSVGNECAMKCAHWLARSPKSHFCVNKDALTVDVL